MIEKTAKLFTDAVMAKQYFENVRRNKPRYTRDQLGLINEQANKYPQHILDDALKYCHENNILSASDFVGYANNLHEKQPQVKLENNNQANLKVIHNKANDLHPETSQISDYENIIHEQHAKTRNN